MTAKHCATCKCEPRRVAAVARADRLDELTAWLTARGGWATRRTLMRGGALGIRTARELDALIDAYAVAHPGSVTLERTGERGPKAVVVHASRAATT